MSPATISAAIGGLVITVLVLAFFFQWRQKHREARQRRLQELKARDRRLRNLADGLQGGLIAADVRLLLSRTGQEVAKELKELGLSDLADEASIDWQTYSGNAAKAAAEPVPKFSNEASAVAARKLLKTLYRFIELQIRMKRLDYKTGYERLQQTQFLIARTMADAHHRKAVDATKQNRLRVAIHHYHDAVAGFAKLQDNPLAIKYINAFRSKIKALEAQATEEQKQKSVETPDPGDSKLKQGWNAIDSEADTWKKKQAYD
ncbi:hypothetical protein [Allohahella sp. A8]|uniref:hypothetical protein n=1 Tax=Allohahella sp. A8 TaxID=3141461 RepID=UPI000C09B772|nr:hypothetical protein [Hahellaceae bacterium]|tara:strand:+ start:85775 stop:86557 length:783 start_codon:yes stop_codon:yes gene_type:complete